MSELQEVARRLLEAAREAGRDALLEPEGYELLAAMGLPVPRHRLVAGADEVTDRILEGLGEELVVKVVSPTILHKSDVGGVALVPAGEAAAAVRDMEARLGERDVVGYLLCEKVEYDRSLGGELLLGYRYTDDFGPVVTFGVGGVYTEFLAANLRAGRDVAILSPALRDLVDVRLDDTAATALVTGALRGQAARVERAALVELVTRFMDGAAALAELGLRELEVNPLVLGPEGPVVVDALAKLGENAGPAAPPRPIDKVAKLLEPRSAAVMGVSAKMNPGHIILNNLIREGFGRENIHVVKPGTEEMEGCRCVPDIASLPEPVDMLVLAIGAEQVPAALEEIVNTRKAESVIVIPGGLGETSGSKDLARHVEKVIAASRATDGRGPVVNGGNCLGIRSRPGRYDTLFIPGHKLPPAEGGTAGMAILSQSGAFSITVVSRLEKLAPKYVVSIGNQMDLTVGDYLEALADDEEIRVFACYVEGFKPLDGERWIRAARRITDSGRHVVLYRAGRTSAGAQASASHSASISGDYAVTRALAEAAGVIVTESIADFEDMTLMLHHLGDKRLEGRRLAAMSNAGFECVAMADNLGALELASLAPATTERLGELFRENRLGSIVDVHNPLDVTPILGDAGWEDGVRVLLDDPGVDLGVIGCVPLSAAVTTLPAGEHHPEDLAREDSVVQRLIRLHRESEKPWVAVVAGGSLYDPMALALTEAGVPTFRAADRALRLLDRYCGRLLAARTSGA